MWGEGKSGLDWMQKMDIALENTEFHIWSHFSQALNS